CAGAPATHNIAAAAANVPIAANLFLRITVALLLCMLTGLAPAWFCFLYANLSGHAPNRWVPNHLTRVASRDGCLGLTSHPGSFDLLAGIDSLSFQRSLHRAAAADWIRVAYISRFFRQWAEMGSSNDSLRSFLAGLFRTAVSAAQ